MYASFPGAPELLGRCAGPRPRIVLHVDDHRREPTYVNMKRAICVIARNATGSRVHHRRAAVQPLRQCRTMVTIVKPTAVPVSICACQGKKRCSTRVGSPRQIEDDFASVLCVAPPHTTCRECTFMSIGKPADLKATNKLLR